MRRLSLAFAMLGAIGVHGVALAQANDHLAGGMREDELRAALALQGYTDIHALEFRGDRWSVEAADRNGRAMQVDVDALTGEIRPQSTIAMPTADAIIVKMLSAGYRKITDVHLSGGLWHAQAFALDDRVVQLTLDPRDGHVIRGD